MALRENLEKDNCPDMRLAAAILLFCYCHAGLTVDLTDENTLKELNRLVGLSDDDFDKEHKMIVKARHQ